MRKRKCKHTTACYRKDVEAAVKYCFGCGETLSLGPSSDDPDNVKVEMRAAELEPMNLFGRDGRTMGERWGWEAHETNDSPISDSYGPAGWLHRELATHDDRETRDADAWPWDPSRVVAGQWELSQRVKAASNALDVHISARTAMDVALKAEEWKWNAPVREAARKFNALIGTTNADGDPVDFATERMASGIAVEDALRELVGIKVIVSGPPVASQEIRIPSDDPFGPVISPDKLDEVERVMTGARPPDTCPDCNGPSYRCTRRKLDGGE